MGKNNNLENLSDAQKVLKTLTGQVGVDKTILKSAMKNFREKNFDPYQTFVLANKLFQILLENGLNESDVINPERLLSKVEGFLYAEKYETALDILEVLDGVQFYKKYDENGKKIYYLNNEIEAEILGNVIFAKLKKEQEISWHISARNIYMSLKIQVYLEQNDIKNAEKCIKELIDFNPVNYNAIMYQAEIYKRKNLKKFKAQLNLAYEYSYCKQHLIDYYKQLSIYYEMSKNLPMAYSTLYAISFLGEKNIIDKDLERLKVEMNKTALAQYQLPNNAKILQNLEDEGISTLIKDDTILLMCSLYEKHYNKDDDPVFLAKLKTFLLELTNESFVNNLEKNSKK